MTDRDEGGVELMVDGRGVGTGAQPRLDARGLQKSFGDFQAVVDVTLTLRPGEIHGFCGPNGAGKSTVVKMLSGQLEPDGGTIHVDGRQVSFSSVYAAQEAGIAIVDQELSVVPASRSREPRARGVPAPTGPGWPSRLARGGAGPPRRRRARPPRPAHSGRAADPRRAAARGDRPGTRAARVGHDPRRAHRDPVRRRDRPGLRSGTTSRGRRADRRVRLAPPRRGDLAVRPRHRRPRRPGHRHHRYRGPDRGGPGRADDRHVRDGLPAHGTGRRRRRRRPAHRRPGRGHLAARLLAGGPAGHRLRPGRAGRLRRAVRRPRARRARARGTRPGRRRRSAARPGRRRPIGAGRHRLRVRRPEERGALPAAQRDRQPHRHPAARRQQARHPEQAARSAPCPRRRGPHERPRAASRRVGGLALRRQPAEGLGRPGARPRRPCGARPRRAHPRRRRRRPRRHPPAAPLDRRRGHHGRLCLDRLDEVVDLPDVVITFWGGRAVEVHRAPVSSQAVLEEITHQRGATA